MGYDVDCTLHLDGRPARGRAQLETQELRFRGDARLVIPLKEITSAAARDGSLTVRFGGRTAVFDLGPSAAKWAERITNPPSRLDKLGVKPGLTVVSIGVPDDRFLSEVASRGAVVARRQPAGGADLVFYGASSRKALDRLPTLVPRIASNGAIWIIRPKGQTTITESDVMRAGKQAGLVDVKVVSFSDTLTAEKFVIPLARRAVSKKPKKIASRNRG